jgi:uncharacterized DUF497 family protein
VSPRIARFQWDEANLAHITLHLVSRDEVEQAFLDDLARLEGSQIVNGEARNQMIGGTKDGRVLAVIFVIRRGEIRPVTAYTAKGRVLARYMAGRTK